MFNDENTDEWTRDFNYQYNGKDNQNELGDPSYFSEIIPDITSMHEEYDDNIDWDNLSDSLSQQVNEELEEKNLDMQRAIQKKMLRKRILIIAGSVMGVLLCCVIFLAGTKPGHKLLYKIAGNYIYGSLDIVEDIPKTSVVQRKEPANKEPDKRQNIASAAEKNGIRQEDYVTNFLIFGIEEYQGAKNTDSMMIASINTKDDTIKLTSLMRDTYLEEIPGRRANKLNSVYAVDGADALVNIIEKYYKIHIDGYASINYDSFEKIINNIGGITLELGQEEASYLNRTNYISNPSYRTVRAGINKLNGNQVLGYCRIRKVKTLEGVNDDYGRTLRQRKAMNAVFDKYKNQGMLDLLSVTTQCLGYVKTNVTHAQIEKAIEDVVENRITKLDSSRIPVDGTFQEPKKYNGIGYPLLIDWDANVKELYKYIYLDKEKITPTAAPSVVQTDSTLK